MMRQMKTKMKGLGFYRVWMPNYVICSG